MKLPKFEVRRRVIGRRGIARSERGCCPDGNISAAVAGSRYGMSTGSSWTENRRVDVDAGW